MGVHIEAQDNEALQQIRAREIQLENIDKLDIITDAVDNINIEPIENATNEIKEIVQNNLEEQPNLDELLTTMHKIAQGVVDIKRNQTNLNKKINDIQSTIDDLSGENNE